MSSPTIVKPFFCLILFMLSLNLHGQEDYFIDQNGSFSPIPGTGTSVSLNDDQLSTALPIGFSFEFFSQPYSDFYISSNGYISFDPNAGDGCCSGQDIPDTDDPNNLIAFAWGDLNPTSGGDINYFTVGNSPNRRLVMNFEDITHCCAGSGPITSQVILFEGSNRIEIHTTSKPDLSNDQTMGIENADGSIAYSIPGRNRESWSATNDFVSFFQGSGQDNDAGVFGLNESICAGIQDLGVTVQNFGSNQINSLQVAWTLDGQAQSPVNINFLIDTLNGMSPSSQSVILDQIDFQLGQTYDIKAWTLLPNGIADPNTSNDTLEITISPALSGNLSIGGVSPDYPDFNSAITALNSYGVCGNVIFDVRSGTYTEALAIGTVSGAGPDAQITFRSESGDSTSVVIQNTGDINDNYVIQLNGSGFINFENLTLKALDPNFGRVIDLKESCSNIRFSNSVIEGLVATFSSFDNSLVYSVEGGLDQITFSNNRFLNGSEALSIDNTFDYYYYEVNKNKNLTIRDNEFENAYSRAILINQATNIDISGNRFETNTNFIGFQAVLTTETDGTLEISRNRIDLPDRGSGIFVSNFFPTGVMISGIVSNNYIYAPSGDGSGIRISNGENIGIYFNSVQYNGDAGSSYAFWTQFGSMDIRNNIFANTGQGYAARIQSTSSIDIMDYNCLFSNGSFVVLEGSSDLDFAAWQASSGFDVNSLEVDPAWPPGVDLSNPNTQLKGAGTPIAGVLTDIDGDIRNALNPDIGADEFELSGLDAGIQALASPISMFAPGDQNIRVAIQNQGLDPITELNIDWLFKRISSKSSKLDGDIKFSRHDSTAARK